MAPRAQTQKRTMKNQITTRAPKQTLPFHSADSTRFPPTVLEAVGTIRPGMPPDLSEQKILRWADAFFERKGRWPDWQSGPVPESPGDTWYTVAAALALGLRGLSRRGSLERLIKKRRRPRKKGPGSISVAQILQWVDDWIAENGRRLTRDSGAIPGSGGLKWSDVNRAPRVGGWGLPGGSSLAEFVARERPVRRPRTDHRKTDLVLGRCVPQAERSMAARGLRPNPGVARRLLVHAELGA